MHEQDRGRIATALTGLEERTKCALLQTIARRLTSSFTRPAPELLASALSIAGG
jgi:hypothetical protein